MQLWRAAHSMPLDMNRLIECAVIRESKRCLQYAISRRLWASLGVLLCVSLPPCSQAAVLEGNPANYQMLAAELKAGDTLHLAPGTYDQGLLLINKAGTAAQPIVIVGPPDHSARLGAPDCCSVVQLRDASFLQIRNLTLEVNSTGIDSSGSSHHVLLENLQIVGSGGGGHTVGIAANGPAADWTIRRDLISGVETGIRLGNADRTAPFSSGLIEYNAVVDTSGANMQIADAVGSAVTIRHNTFSKDFTTLMSELSANASEIYGNVFYSGTRGIKPSLSGIAGAHDNLLVDSAVVDSSNPYVEASGTGLDAAQWRIAALRIAAATPTVTMTASPTNVATGGTTQISWTSTGASACGASGGWTGTKGPNGSETVGPIRASTSYQLTCLGEGGNAGAMVLVTVGGSAPDPTPTPDPTPIPTPSPDPTPTPPTGSQMSGGGGAMDPMAIALLTLFAVLKLRWRSPRSPQSQDIALANNCCVAASLVDSRQRPAHAARPLPD